MNERIEKLAEQARDWADTEYKQQNDQFTSHWDNPIGYTPSQLFEQKFAELIVKECASLFEDELRPMGDFTERACRRAIKEHFGVEE